MRGVRVPAFFGQFAQLAHFIVHKQGQGNAKMLRDPTVKEYSELKQMRKVDLLIGDDIFAEMDDVLARSKEVQTPMTCHNDVALQVGGFFQCKIPKQVRG